MISPTSCPAKGIEAAGAAADVGNPDQAQKAVDELTRALGNADVLVNNAGVLIAKPFEQLTLEEWDTTWGPTFPKPFP